MRRNVIHACNLLFCAAGLVLAWGVQALLQMYPQTGPNHVMRASTAAAAGKLPPSIDMWAGDGSVEIADPPRRPIAHIVPASRKSDSPVQQNPWLAFHATWYSPIDGPGQGVITATGTHVKDGWTIAVDPHIIPLGSIVEIRFPDGRVHTYLAEDTGGAIRGRHIDIYNPSHAECLYNGIQQIWVRIVRRGWRG